MTSTNLLPLMGVYWSELTLAVHEQDIERVCAIGHQIKRWSSTESNLENRAVINIGDRKMANVTGITGTFSAEQLNSFARTLGMSVDAFTVGIAPLLAAYIAKGYVGEQLYRAAYNDLVGMIHWGVTNVSNQRAA